MFATHYHELTDLADKLPGVANLNVAVREWQDQVIFLHQIVPGAADKSYGIHVAKIAGVPREVNDRAAEILATLESARPNEQTAVSRNPKSAQGSAPAPRRTDPDHAIRRSNGRQQLTLFDYADHPLLEIIRAAELDDLNDSDLRELVSQWQEQLNAEVVDRAPAM